MRISKSVRPSIDGSPRFVCRQRTLSSNVAIGFDSTQDHIDPPRKDFRVKSGRRGREVSGWEKS